MQSNITKDENDNLYMEAQATHNMYSNFYYNENDEISKENGPLLNLGISVDTILVLLSSNYELLVSDENGIPKGFIEDEENEEFITAPGVSNVEFNDFNLRNNFVGEEPEDSLMYFKDENYGYFPVIDSKEKQKYQSVIAYANGVLTADDEFIQEQKNKGVTRLYYRAGIKLYFVCPAGVSEEEAKNGDLWRMNEEYKLYFESTVKYIDL